MSKIQLSPWKSHVEKWSNCQDCGLSVNRSLVVLARGSIPCDVLLVGMAPGRSEDVLGKPFIGPAGKLSESIFAEAVSPLNERRPSPISFAYTNLVCCIPTGANSGVRDPEAEEINACSPRLLELVELAHPKLIVAVGTLSDRWLPKLLGDSKIGMATVDHPSFILRSNYAQRSHMIQRSVVVLRSAMEEHVC